MNKLTFKQPQSVWQYVLITIGIFCTGAVVVISFANYYGVNGFATILSLVIFLSIFGTFKYIVATSRKIYLDEDTLTIKYNVLFWKNKTLPLQECLGYFPYSYRILQTHSYNSSQHGVVLLFKDNDIHLKVVRYGGQKGEDDIHKVVNLLQRKQIRNLNPIPNYQIDSKHSFNFGINVMKKAKKAFEKSRGESLGMQ